LVSFLSDFGSAVAYWEGEKPTIKGNYQVEVNISKKLVWRKDVLFDDTNSGDSIYIRDDNTFISGCIDSLDEDGYTILRLGDNIIPFFAIGKAFPIGTRITMAVEKLTFSPVNY
jgi:hypothetical protein